MNEHKILQSAVKEQVNKVSKPLASAVVSQLIPVYTWPWAALVNVPFHQL